MQQQPAGGAEPGPLFGNPQPHQMPGAMNNGGRLVLLSGLQERQNDMRNALIQLERQIRGLTAARFQTPDQVSSQKMRAFTVDLTQKRNGLQRLMALINQMESQGKTHLTLPMTPPPSSPISSGGQPWMQPPANLQSPQPLAAVDPGTHTGSRLGSQRKPGTNLRAPIEKPRTDVTPITWPNFDVKQTPPANSSKRLREDDGARYLAEGAGGAPSFANNATAGPSSQANGSANQPPPLKKLKSQQDRPPSENKEADGASWSWTGFPICQGPEG
ncbi:hypothetical protein PM082_019163 [Marasmius tenuissimus]|nr:hypothetical protein PM082_019163 [Marasmius tenuissimus]